MLRMLKIGFFLLSVFVSTVLEAQGNFTVSGYMRDAATGEELIGATVTMANSGTGTIANEYGYYALSLAPGFYTLV